MYIYIYIITGRHQSSKVTDFANLIPWDGLTICAQSNSRWSNPAGRTRTVIRKPRRLAATVRAGCTMDVHLLNEFLMGFEDKFRYGHLSSAISDKNF